MTPAGDHPGGADLRTLAAEIQHTKDLVDEVVKEVQASAVGHRMSDRLRSLGETLARRPDLTALPSLVLRVYSEVTDALGGIKRGREAIRHVAFERIQKSQARISEVTNATESATLELLNGLERSLGLIDRLCGMATNNPEAGAAIETLRSELNQLFGHLQFQDITAQQLAGVAGLLEDIEARVQSVVSLFDGRGGGTADDLGRPEDAPFNPAATFLDTQRRQAAIDAAFSKPGAEATP